MATSTITLKADTTANWEASNRILELDEPGIERTVDGFINMKIGDGVTPWKTLGYVFKLKTLEELKGAASQSATDSAKQVELAKAEVTKCIEEYQKTKNIADGLVTGVNEATTRAANAATNAENAASAANEAARKAENAAAGAAVIEDSLAAPTTTYSSTKIEELFNGTLKIDDTMESLTSTYSSQKIKQMVSEAGGAKIDDITPSAGTTYSSSKIGKLISGVINDSDYSSYVTTYSAQKIEELLGNKATIDDVWSDTMTTYSSAKIEELIASVGGVKIDDATKGATTTYSSEKIEALVSNAGGAKIDDVTPSPTNTYSSQKIQSMLKVLATNRPHEWGVRYPLSGTGSDPAGIRLGDAVGLVANVGTDTVKAYNDFDYLTPWKGRRVNGHYDPVSGDFVVTAAEGEPNFKLDGTHGDVYVERHLFYYKYVFEADYYEVWISDAPLDGYSIPDRFITPSGRVLDTWYRPCYDMSLEGGTKPRSASGKDPVSKKSYSQYLTYLKNLDAGYHLESIKDRQVDSLLFTVEFATRDSQSIMAGFTNISSYSSAYKVPIASSGSNKILIRKGDVGNFRVGMVIIVGTANGGSDILTRRKITAIQAHNNLYSAIVYDGVSKSIAVNSYITVYPYDTGETDSVLTPSGSPGSNTDGMSPMRYRYVENLWGNQNVIIGDLLFQNGTVYVCKNPVKAATSITADYEQVGYTVPITADYISKLGWDPAHPYVRLCVEATGGGSALHFCDGLSNARSNGLSVVIYGGANRDIKGAGIFSQDMNFGVNTTSYSLTTRLSYTPQS